VLTLFRCIIISVLKGACQSAPRLAWIIL